MKIDKRRRPIQHGTVTAYTSRHCRCDVCKANWTAFQRNYRKKHPAIVHAISKRWYKKNAEWRTITHRFNRRGLTLDQYHALAERQDFCCAICGEELDFRPTVDHCHATNRVRGLLCMNCNLGLGHFGDHPARLVSAAQYLERNRATGVG